jgi:DNA repair exonuclease SbcCD ATPase subunit
MVSQKLFSLDKRAEEISVKREFLRAKLSDLERSKTGSDIEYENFTKARSILIEANRLTQQRFKEKVESLVTVAIKSVFSRDLKFIMEVGVKKNRSEVLFFVQEGDKEPYIPKDEQGGGLLDIISFALRIVLWSIESPRSRNVFVLDEPMKWTGALIVKAANMMKEISRELGIQIIMVTHDSELEEVADRTWQISHDGDRSSIIQGRIL